MTVVLLLVSVVCGIGWLIRWLNTSALILYLLEKGYPVPTKEEWEACTQKILMHLIRTND